MIETGDLGQSSLERQVAALREVRKSNRKNVLILILVVTIIITAIYIWQWPVTGMHSLNTIEQGPFIAGSSSDRSISFERIPDFSARVGEQVRFKVDANQKGLHFSDNTLLFEISPEGEVDFTPEPENTGTYNVWIIANDDAMHYYYQNVRIIIEEN